MWKYIYYNYSICARHNSMENIFFYIYVHACQLLQLCTCTYYVEGKE